MQTLRRLSILNEVASLQDIVKSDTEAIVESFPELNVLADKLSYMMYGLGDTMDINLIPDSNGIVSLFGNTIMTDKVPSREAHGALVIIARGKLLYAVVDTERPRQFSVMSWVNRYRSLMSILPIKTTRRVVCFITNVDISKEDVRIKFNMVSKNHFQFGGAWRVWKQTSLLGRANILWEEY